MKAYGKVAVPFHAFLNNALKSDYWASERADNLRKIPLAYTGNRNDSSSQFSRHYTD
jgi:hypothetical protein